MLSKNSVHCVNIRKKVRMKEGVMLMDINNNLFEIVILTEELE